MAEKIDVFVRLSLIVGLALTQVPCAYSIEISTPRVSNVNNCNAVNPDFEADLNQIAEKVRERTALPSELLQKYFARCTLEEARQFLNNNGFYAGQPLPEFDESVPKKVIPRTVVSEKTFGHIGPLVTLNCRIVLKNDASNELRVFGFFYFDGP